MLLRRYKDRLMDTSKEDSASKTIEDMTAEELKAYAETQGIDIGKSTSKKSILEKIQKANAE